MTANPLNLRNWSKRAITLEMFSQYCEINSGQEFLYTPVIFNYITNFIIPFSRWWQPRRLRVFFIFICFAQKIPKLLTCDTSEYLFQSMIIQLVQSADYLWEKKVQFCRVSFSGCKSSIFQGFAVMHVQQWDVCHRVQAVQFGGCAWRKKKGLADLQLPDGHFQPSLW